MEQYIIYELHVATFTPQGTFDGVVSRLDYLCELGITAVELMPVAQFPGTRNWGYDGTFPFAPQNSYGGTDGLKRLINACHGKGLAVILDVVYNHLGPEGNYLQAFGPYFTDRYRTPWGDAINFDGPDSDPVRHYFISNALYWVTEYHMDSLRLDAIHCIFDFSARHILQELTEAVHQQAKSLGRQCYVIAESNLNDVRVITPSERGGYGLDAQWNDDFHHALRTFLTGDRSGYYADFGTFSDLVKAFSTGFVLDGVYSIFYKRRHGSSSVGCPPSQMVVFSQNHDQLGNRMYGERMHEYLSYEQLRLAAATVLLSPYIPLLFMGEEYIEPAPFPYFISHGNPDLIEAVRVGRKRGFAPPSWAEEIPDPQAEATFLSAQIDPVLHSRGDHALQFAFYRELIRLRKELTPPVQSDGKDINIFADGMRQVLIVRRSHRDGTLLCLFNFSEEFRSVELPPTPGQWRVALESTAPAGTQDTGSAAEHVVEQACIDLAPFAVVVCRHRDSQ